MGNKKSKLPVLEKTPEHKYTKTNGMHLIVDDSDVNRLVVSKYLNRFKYKTNEAQNGLEAIERVKKYGTYDIIWMDLQMPKMNGIDCAKYLRNQLQYTGIILGLTGHVDVDSVNICKNAGMDDVIAKPVEKDVLFEYAKQYCGLIR